MATPEGRIRNAIMSWLKFHRAWCVIYDSVGIYDQKRGCYRVRHSVHRKVGVPDILGIWRGRFLAIEVKVPGNRPTEHQTRCIEEIRAHGGIAFVATSLKEVELRLLNTPPPEAARGPAA